MKKEKVTYQDVITDLKNARKYQIRHIILWCFYSVILLVGGLFFGFLAQSGDIIIIIYTVIAAVFFIAYSIMLLQKILKFKALSKAIEDGFSVKTDVLIDYDYRRGRYSRYYWLNFTKHGKYYIPPVSYEWSSEFCLGVNGVITYAFKDTEYYLVVSKEKRQDILVAYNSKLFELDDQLKHLI